MPLGLSPFVCFAETLRYVVRPFVLVFRPWFKFSVGSFLMHAIGQSCCGFEGLMLFLMLFLFYEAFVTVVQWLIVCSILSFSVDH